MKNIFTQLIFLVFCMLPSLSIEDNNWVKRVGKFYDLYYTKEDQYSIKEYQKLFAKALKTTESFFKAPYQSHFDIFVHPHRKSLDSTWSKDWSMPDFKSECWMVAGGVGKRVDLISPKTWDKESCEHHYSNKSHTQNLLTHELVHVFHGQLNASSDFSDVENIDWFVEGLATYASGQLDSLKIAAVVENIKIIPVTLDKFWTGKFKYGLSGTMVMFIDKKYGRAKLKTLLPFNKKQQMLAALSITEPDLLSEWHTYMETFARR